MYEYAAKVLRVVDGDTVWLDVDLGFEVGMAMSIRLMGIDAPETRTEEGKVSKAYLMARLPPGKEVVLRTIKDRKEKYGRYLGMLWVGEECLNSTMIERGLAAAYDGGPRT